MKAIAFLLYIALWLGAGVGWCMNVYKFATSDFDAPYKSEIIRGVGIPVGIMGAVTGYMTIDDEN